MAVATDVRDEQSVAQLFATVEEVHGRLDVIFNNAGINAPAVPVDELPLENWRNVIATNVDGVFLCSRGLRPDAPPAAARRADHQQRLDIGAYPAPFTRPYTASKHAVLGLTKALALDGRPYNIVCSQVDIGNAPDRAVRAHDRVCARPSRSPPSQC